jgi:tRNA (guanine-N7-)-methyltransferase
MSDSANTPPNPAGRAARPYADAPRLPEGDNIALDELFRASGPIEIEIGPGRGAFARERCVAAPEARLLGIEIRRKWATIVNDRLAHDGYADRARVMCEDARLALPRLQPDASVARVFILFPDPWWKKRHQKRLVVVDPLIAEVGRLLVDGGELFVQTDVPNRADEYRERLDRCEFLEPAGDEPGSPLMKNNPYGARTNREKRADEDGLPVHRLRYRRAARAT